LVLNGRGQRAHALVGTIFKTQVELIVTRIDDMTPLHRISLAIANPKKDAFEDIIKIAVELGVQVIYPIRSEFSQYDYEENERIQRIQESALIQSNNDFLPKIHKQLSLENFLEIHQQLIYFFNSNPMETSKLDKKLIEKTVLIGPEGGFSAREESLILSKQNVLSIHMPTPIQRAPTAVASSIGYLLSP
jgi:16S rRNA (uracil1498-N3)-methyltransferase